VAVLAVAARGAQPLRVGLVLEQPLTGRSDDPFQHGAYLGLARAVRELHVQGKVVSPSPNAYSAVPAVSFLARQRYDLVMGIGFLVGRDVVRTARLFPSRRFALLDARREDFPHTPRNVEGTLFATQEPSYLAGYLAAKMDDLRKGPHVVSTVAGIPIPPVQAFIAGFQAGAHRADPKIATLNAYTYNFVNTTKCASAARAQIARGSGVIFDVAGACGLGALEVAKTKGVWGIGVDIDQSYLGSFVLTSVVKHMDVAVYKFVQELRAGGIRTGGDTVFDLQNGGVGLGRFSPRVPPAFRRELVRLRKQIVAGRIVVPAALK